jgi:hypothetical protein
MHLTESSVAVAAPVKGGLGRRQALSKVTVNLTDYFLTDYFLMSDD